MEQCGEPESFTFQAVSFFRNVGKYIRQTSWLQGTSETQITWWLAKSFSSQRGLLAQSRKRGLESTLPEQPNLNFVNTSLIPSNKL